MDLRSKTRSQRGRSCCLFSCQQRHLGVEVAFDLLGALQAAAGIDSGPVEGHRCLVVRRISILPDAVELGHIALEWQDDNKLIDSKYYEIQNKRRIFMRHVPGPKAADRTIVERYLDLSEIIELHKILVDSEALAD